MLEAITQKVDSSAVAHPNGTKVAGTFADRPSRTMSCGACVLPFTVAVYAISLVVICECAHIGLVGRYVLILRD